MNNVCTEHSARAFQRFPVFPSRLHVMKTVLHPSILCKVELGQPKVPFEGVHMYTSDINFKLKHRELRFFFSQSLCDPWLPTALARDLFEPMIEK